MIVWWLTTDVPIADDLQVEISMNEDPRCCGTGTCIINDDGICWCGQRWNGEEMCFPKADNSHIESAQRADDTRSSLSQSTSRAENAGSSPTHRNP